MTAGRSFGRLADLAALNSKGELRGLGTNWPIWKPLDPSDAAAMEAQSKLLSWALGKPTFGPGDLGVGGEILMRKREYASLPNLINNQWGDVESAFLTGKQPHPEVTALVQELYGVPPAPAASTPRAEKLGGALLHLNTATAAPAPQRPANPWGPDVPDAPIDQVPADYVRQQRLGPAAKPDVVESAAERLTNNLANVTTTAGADIAPVIVADMQEAAATAAAPSRRPAGPRSRMANRRRQQMQQESPNLAVVIPADADRKAGGPDVRAFLAQALSSPDFGAGAAVQEALNRAADALEASRPPRQHQWLPDMSAVGDLRRTAALAGWALPAGAAAASVGIPVMMAAADGNEAAGGGGALVQGAGALTGAAMGGRYGTIGRLLGGTVGGAAAGFPVDWARSAVDAKDAGDVGLAGALGRIADPLIDSSREIEERQLRAQLNSPVVKMMEERRRQERHDALMQQMQNALLQSYLN